jgi:hypothetical protein
MTVKMTGEYWIGGDVKGKIVAESETLSRHSGYPVFCPKYESRGLSNTTQTTFSVSLLSCSWSFVYSTPFCACIHICNRIFDVCIGIFIRQSV